MVALPLGRIGMWSGALKSLRSRSASHFRSVDTDSHSARRPPDRQCSTSTPAICRPLPTPVPSPAPPRAAR
eukprot:6464755-Pyramimonas_sp.AAC.1